MKKPDLKSFDLKALADDFKNLNPQDVGAWPLLPRLTVLVVLFAAILGAGYWFIWKGQIEVFDIVNGHSPGNAFQYCATGPCG